MEKYNIALNNFNLVSGASELAPTPIYDEEASFDLRVAAGSDDIFKEEVEDRAWTKVAVPLALLATHIICAVVGHFLGRDNGV